MLSSNHPTIHPTRALWGARMGFMSYGWDAGVLGGVLQTSAFQEAMGYPSTTVSAMIVASFLLASWLGCCIAASPWSDRLGRRVWMILGAAIQVVGTILSVASFSYGQLIAGRVVIGIGNGLVVATAPVLIAEITVSTASRGPLVGMLMGTACTATALAYWIDFGFTFASGQVVWRLPVALQIVWSLLCILLMLPNADSPRWYYLRQQPEAGDAILTQLIPHDHTLRERTRAAILAELAASASSTTPPLRPRDFLLHDRSPEQAGRRIRDGVLLVGIAYLMGVNTIFYYTTTIFQVYIGLAPTTASVCSGAATTLLAVGVFGGARACERAGRKRWLLWGAALQSGCMIAFVACLAVAERQPPGGPASKAAAAMLFAWIAAFAPTWAPLPYIYVSETMPLRHRHTGVGLSLSSQWLMAFLTVYAGPIGFERVGWKIWCWFAVFNVLGFPYVYFFLRESKGRSLEEMNGLFGAEVQGVTVDGRLVSPAASVGDEGDGSASGRSVEKVHVGSLKE